MPGNVRTLGGPAVVVGGAGAFELSVVSELVPDGRSLVFELFALRRPSKLQNDNANRSVQSVTTAFMMIGPP